MREEVRRAVEYESLQAKIHVVKFPFPLPAHEVVQSTRRSHGFAKPLLERCAHLRVRHVIEKIVVLDKELTKNVLVKNNRSRPTPRGAVRGGAFPAAPHVVEHEVKRFRTRVRSQRQE